MFVIKYKNIKFIYTSTCTIAGEGTSEKFTERDKIGTIWFTCYGC